MGITGLLPFLKDASRPVNIKDFAGQTVAVDTYCWIYRGAFSCAEELALGKKADGHVKYVLKYVQRFLEWGIKPIMVFDGNCLPSKKGTEVKRRESKDAYKKKAAQFLMEGKRTEARECFQRSIDCTPQMALDVIQALHELGVDVCVAPYEADAQLCYLNKIKLAQIIITEDSDLILFGCEKVIYKLDINGNGTLVEKEKIVSITQFDSADNFQRFRWMCILSGCDYLDSLPGIGLGKAKKLLKTIKKSEIDHVFKLMPSTLKMPNLNISSEYIENFKRADKTFKYQIVFDPRQRKLVSLHPYEENDEAEDLTYAGFFYEDEEALQHSLGNIEVHTRKVHYNFDPDNSKYKPPVRFMRDTPPYMKSIWSKHYQPYDGSKPSNSKMIKNFFMKTNQPNEIKERPSTLGITKKLNVPFQSPLGNKKSKDAGVKESKTKRKFDMLNSLEDLEEATNSEDSQQSGYSESDGGYITGSNESTVKRSRTECVASDIDNMLSGYTNENENKPVTEQITEQGTGFLQQLSPIKELLIHDEDSSDEIKEIKSEFIQLTEKYGQSPILTKKVKLGDFSAKNSNKFKIKRNLENSPILNAQNEMSPILIESSTTSLKITTTPVEISTTETGCKSQVIIDDIENIENNSAFKTEPVNNVYKYNSISKKDIKSTSKKEKKGLNPSQNQKPITAFLQFEFTKTKKLSH